MDTLMHVLRKILEISGLVHFVQFSPRVATMKQKSNFWHKKNRVLPQIIYWNSKTKRSLAIFLSPPRYLFHLVPNFFHPFCFLETNSSPLNINVVGRWTFPFLDGLFFKWRTCQFQVVLGGSSQVSCVAKSPKTWGFLGPFQIGLNHW